MNQLATNEFAVQPTPAVQPETLRSHVIRFAHMYIQEREKNNLDLSDVYTVVTKEVESGMLEIVMKHCKHNQTKAAKILGINRGTLRKLLKLYGLL